MFRFSRLSRGAAAALVLGATTITVAGAATFHRFATQTAGSNGATSFLQSSVTSSALQGDVGNSDTTYTGTPFGVFGVYDNSGSNFGVGVLGLSTTGYAIAGESLSATQPSFLAYSGGNGPGMESLTTSTSSSPGIYSEAKGSGDGVDGQADGGGVGLSGVSKNGSGISAKSTNYDGLDAYSTSGDGAVIGNANGSNANTLLIENESVSTVGNLIEATSYANSYQYSPGNNCNNGPGDCMTLDKAGNLVVAGSITDANGSYARTRNPSTDLMSYGEQAAEPMMEDVGSAKLVDGAATVSLANDFRATIDGSRYMVFLTPYGENNGLYISSRTATGFSVREVHGGRSTLAFDYRIVAQQYGMHDGRLPHYATLHPHMRELQQADDMRKLHAVRRAAFVPPPITAMPVPGSFSRR